MKHTAASRQGFTLLEIMIVVFVLSILLMIAVPQYMGVRTSSQRSGCLQNLKEIEAAKELWATQMAQPPAATPAQSDLVPVFLKYFPSCPAAGSYTIGTLAVPPTCTIAGHLLQ